MRLSKLLLPAVLSGALLASPIASAFAASSQNPTSSGSDFRSMVIAVDHDRYDWHDRHHGRVEEDLRRLQNDFNRLREDFRGFSGTGRHADHDKRKGGDHKGHRGGRMTDHDRDSGSRKHGGYNKGHADHDGYHHRSSPPRARIEDDRRRIQEDRRRLMEDRRQFREDRERRRDHRNSDNHDGTDLQTRLSH